MSTYCYWRVKEVRRTTYGTWATLMPVEWFKDNPDWDQASRDDETVTEFLDATPYDSEAEWMGTGGQSITVDVSGGPALDPQDDVVMSLHRVSGLSNMSESIANLLAKAEEYGAHREL